MAFGSMAFLFGFLPAVLACYFLIPARRGRWRNGVLLAFSLIFYAWGGMGLLPVLAASCVLSWAGGLLAAPGRPCRRGALVLLVAADVAILGYFKYTGFLVENLNALGLDLAAPAVALPAGISFFTFQAIAYVADVYRGTVPPERNLGKVALFTAFFPQLLQGPILRYGDFGPQMEDRRETAADAAAGATRFCFGLAKKVLLADMLGQVANGAFSAGSRLTTALAWLGALCYTLQIYYDFSGYSDMAIGMGRMFGFHFLENFNYPYISRSVTEFWRRWHISLSTWFRDYLYIPLGGSRGGRGKTLRNLFVVWLLTGVWHGASWTFVAWGLLYFLLLVPEKLWGWAVRWPALLGWAWTFLMVNFGWVLFRAGTLPACLDFLGAMFGQGGGPDLQAAYYWGQYWVVILLGVLLAFPVAPWLTRKVEDYLGKYARHVFPLWDAVYGLALTLIFLASAAFLVKGTYNPFIYFNF